MSKNHWYIPLNPEKIFDTDAVKHRITKELCLFGQNGQIWQYSKTHLGLVTDSVRIIKKLDPNSKPKGDNAEFMLILPKSELKTVKKMLKVPKNVEKQLELALSI